MKKLGILFLFLLTAFECDSKSFAELPADLRTQSQIRQEWLKIRLERVLPDLMRKHRIQMWIVICREYNEDPVFYSLVSPDVFAARRRTIYVFFDRGPKEQIERLALGGGSNGGLYRVYRDPDIENRELWGEGQWAVLKKVIEERNPRNIAINVSRTHAFSDGLSASEKESFEKTLSDRWKSRIVNAELLPLEYISSRIPEMTESYRRIMQLAHSLISTAFSREVIRPGQTTNHDVEWWLRNEVRNKGFAVWFHPSVHVQRQGASGIQLLAEEQETVIQRGDVLHVDFGITAMGLNTDTQHMGYVLQNNEKDVPPGIREALQNSNRLQDLLMERMKPGKTGNQVLAETLEAMKAEKINGTVYTHPIGDHGHGAGPLIGLWDRQEPIPGRGDVEILDQTWFSIELATQTKVPEWNQDLLWVGQEEDAMMIDGSMQWVLPRQVQYHLIR